MWMQQPPSHSNHSSSSSSGHRSNSSSYHRSNSSSDSSSAHSIDSSQFINGSPLRHLRHWRRKIPCLALFRKLLDLIPHLPPLRCQWISIPTACVITRIVDFCLPPTASCRSLVTWDRIPDAVITSPTRLTFAPI